MTFSSQNKPIQAGFTKSYSLGAENKQINKKTNQKYEKI